MLKFSLGLTACLILWGVSANAKTDVPTVDPNSVSLTKSEKAALKNLPANVRAQAISELKSMPAQQRADFISKLKQMTPDARVGIINDFKAGAGVNTGMTSRDTAADAIKAGTRSDGMQPKNTALPFLGNSNNMPPMGAPGMNGPAMGGAPGIMMGPPGANGPGGMGTLPGMNGPAVMGGTPGMNVPGAAMSDRGVAGLMSGPNIGGGAIPAMPGGGPGGPPMGARPTGMSGGSAPSGGPQQTPSSTPNSPPVGMPPH